MQCLSATLHKRGAGDVPVPSCYPCSPNTGESDVAGIQVALHRAVVCHS